MSLLYKLLIQLGFFITFFIVYQLILRAVFVPSIINDLIYMSLVLALPIVVFRKEKIFNFLGYLTVSIALNISFGFMVLAIIFKDGL